jgi:hypothetical protein
MALQLIRSGRFRKVGVVNQFGSRRIEAGGYRDSFLIKLSK